MSAFGSDRVERAVVVGAGATVIGRHPDRTPTDLGLEALAGALAGAGLRQSELEGVFLVPEGYIRAQPPIRPQRVAERLGLGPRALVEVECGGTSAMLAFKAACQEIALGRLNVAAAIGAQAERRTFRAGMDCGDLDRVLLVNAMYGSYLGPYGVVAALPCYALAAQRYMHDHQLSPEAVAELAVRLRAHAANNPRAELRDPISVDDVLASRMVCPPIHKLEAAPWSDGGAAAVVVSASYARRRGLRGAALTGWGEAHDDANFIPFGKDLTRYPWIGTATEEALGHARRGREDLDVLEVYGAFAPSELMTYEAMGLFSAGDAPAAVARGETALGGPLPINPSGGRLSLGHPPQATPLLMIGEILDQLTGIAGARQVDNAAVGLVQAEHGMMNGGAVAILEADG
ncbi:MAG TPA: thiolase family protein [Solirubrobacteraceae bacterium]|jgi:acetyl-CoA acetyltransferase|nr:thiolase family protein [Solirubrobacteraceae bacterium]